MGSQSKSLHTKLLRTKGSGQIAFGFGCGLAVPARGSTSGPNADAAGPHLLAGNKPGSFLVAPQINPIAGNPASCLCCA